MKQLALVLLTLWVAWLGAEGLSQKLVDADDLSVGDRFGLELRADTDLKSVVVPDTLSVFQVLSAELVNPRQGPDWLKLTIVPLYPGSHSFPALEVRAADPAAAPLFSDRFRLNIIPVRVPADTLLVDIKPLEKYPFQLPWWLYILLPALALAGLLLALFYKKRPAPATEAPAAPVAPPAPDPAWKLALNQLDALRAEELMLKGQAKQHHFRLSEILRQFLQRKYRFSAPEMSTAEIDWVTRRIHVDSAPEVISFLNYCDRVKFAKYLPGWDETSAAEDWLGGWLRSFEVEEARQKLAGGGGDA